MQSVHADEQDMFDLTAAQLIVSRTRRNRCSKQADTKRKYSNAFSQGQSPFMNTT
jgi:hypothetical protein